MLQTSMEHDNVEGHALAQARGVRVVTYIPTFIFHIRRLILVAVFDGPRTQIDGDDLDFPFFCTESGYSFREMTSTTPRVKNTESEAVVRSILGGPFHSALRKSIQRLGDVGP